jgi:hypothetical protein
MRLPLFATGRHPLPENGLYFECEVLTGSFGAVPPPRH